MILCLHLACADDEIHEANRLDRHEYGIGMVESGSCGGRRWGGGSGGKRSGGCILVVSV